MGFSHYQVWVLTNIWLKRLVLSSWSRRKSPLVLAWKHLFSMVLHVPMQFLRHTNSLSFFLPFTNIFLFPLSFPHHQLYSVEKKRLGGENRGIRIYIFIKQSLHSSKKKESLKSLLCFANIWYLGACHLISSAQKESWIFLFFLLPSKKFVARGRGLI